MDVQPYKVEIPDAVLEDLKARLVRTRWPDEIPGSDWDYGTNLAYLKELVEYWRTGFDWRGQEAVINSFAHFRTTVDDMGIHFIHQEGKGPNPLPIVLTHGWPGSFFEMYKLIPLLTDPGANGADANDSFHVVVPSMPGYGFSDLTTRRGVNAASVSDLWVQLMTEGLGYQRFGGHGGDWGAGITARLGFAYPEHLLGIHLTSVGGSRRGAEQVQLSEAEQERRYAGGGYGHIQGTKPQTLSYGLNDSPAGLAAWIVEKYRAWSDCDGDVERRFTKDELLTTVTIYWVTQTANSSARLYYESRRDPWSIPEGESIKVPCGAAIFPRDIGRPSRESAEQSYNLQRWTDMPSGGHFAALEEPQLLAQDLREFFRPLRD